MTIPVLFLHCSGSSGAQWHALAAQLNPRYRAITPDLASEPSLARVAARVLEALGRPGQPAHLVGHSFGGALALHLARTRPGRFRSLTLIEPSAFNLLRGGDAIDAAAQREISGVSARVRTALASGDQHGGYGQFFDYWSGPGSWAALPQERRDAFAPKLANIALDFDALLGEPARLEDFAHLGLPTLLVQGGRTELPSRCICQRLRVALPSIRFRAVQGAGHMLPFTHRDAVNALIAEHLDSWSAALQEKAA